MRIELGIYNIFYLNKQQVKNQFGCLRPVVHNRAAKQPKPVYAKSYRHKQILITLKQIKMKTQKMSLANIQGKLSRVEMKNIMAGSGGCYIVSSSQGYQSCWYTSGDEWSLCRRVYGNNCNGASNAPINCSQNNCTMH
jgi:hypothetical protein